MHTNIENTDQIIVATKSSVVQRPHTSHATHRNALGDIGNKVSAISISDVSKKGPVKKEIVQLTTRQQQKILTKSKGTTSLKSLAEDNGAKQVNIFIEKVKNNSNSSSLNL